MIGQSITDEKGNPLPQYEKLSPSTYNPPKEVKELFQRVQRDYQIAWNLQHRNFDEFDGMSLLQRSKKDQETFGAFVGAVWMPQHKKWRWRGRKNTARNKLIGILAHMLAGMLFPNVSAQNNEDEPDKMTARVMRLLIEEHLRKAGYRMKFLYMVLSALVNPAVLVEVKYVEAIQKIKQKLEDGSVEVIEAVDELLSGLTLNIIPIDQLLVADFFTGEIQKQPFLIRVNRIPWDTARKIYGDHEDFKYVQAGKTRVVMAGQENQTLFDIEWTEADRMYVQELTAYYRDEDLEVTFVGGVFMGNKDNVYNTNPFSHRRLTLIKDKWITAPIYPFAKSGFEPIDPSGRFFYYKSGAFKEFWDDATQNKMHQLLIDGTYLDVIKPIFMSGVSNADSVVIAPGVSVGMPLGANVTPYQLSPNLAAAMNAMNKEETDMSESTQDRLMNGAITPDVTATQSIQAQNQARIFLIVFSTMVADLITQVGELVMDCEIQHTTQGEIDATIPEMLRIKYKTITTRTKDKGRDVTNRIVFLDSMIGTPRTEEEIRKRQWELYDKAGGEKGEQRIYEVNPYLFARAKYSLFIDPDDIANHAMGNDRQRKMLGFQMLSDPRVAPFTDQKNVVDDFVIEEFADGDPDRYKAKGNVNDMMEGILGQGGMPGTPSPIQGNQVQPPQLPALNQIQ